MALTLECYGLWGMEGRGDSIVGILDSLSDEPDDAVGGKAHTDTDEEYRRSENNKHRSIAPKFKCSLKPVTGIRLTIAGM